MAPLMLATRRGELRDQSGLAGNAFHLRGDPVRPFPPSTTEPPAIPFCSPCAATGIPTPVLLHVTGVANANRPTFRPILIEPRVLRNIPGNGSLHVAKPAPVFRSDPPPVKLPNMPTSHVPTFRRSRSAPPTHDGHPIRTPDGQRLRWGQTRPNPKHSIPSIVDYAAAILAIRTHTDDPDAAWWLTETRSALRPR